MAADHLPTTIEELIEIEDPHPEEAISLSDVKTFHQYRPSDSEFLSLAKVRRDLKLAEDKGEAVLEDEEEERTWKEHLTVIKDQLGQVWKRLELDSLHQYGITPIIAGGWIEHHVLVELYPSLSEDAITRLDDIFSHTYIEADESATSPGYDIQSRDVDIFLCYSLSDAPKAMNGVKNYFRHLIIWNEAEAEAVQRDCVESSGPTGRKDGSSYIEVLASSRAGYSFLLCTEGVSKSVKVQMLPSRDVTPIEVINGFDLDCCCAYYDGEDVMALPRAINAWESKSNIFRPSKIARGFEFRVHKYASRDYDLLFPLKYHPALPPTESGSLPQNKASGDGKDAKDEDMGGMRALLSAECDVAFSEIHGNYLDGMHTPILDRGLSFALNSIWKAMCDGKDAPYSYYACESDSPVKAEHSLSMFLEGSYDHEWMREKLRMRSWVDERAIKPYLRGEFTRKCTEKIKQSVEEGQAALIETIVDAILTKHQTYYMYQLFVEGTPISDRSNLHRTMRQNVDWFCRHPLH